MMGWLIINLSVAAKQFEKTGAISLPMALYQVFTAVKIFLMSLCFHVSVFESPFPLSRFMFWITSGMKNL